MLSAVMRLVVALLLRMTGCHYGLDTTLCAKQSRSSTTRMERPHTKTERQEATPAVLPGAYI